jgi:hypothetical protein
MQGEDGQPDTVGVLHVSLSAVNLGPSYPLSAISAEIGRVAIAAARVDQGYALLLHALHAGQRAEWALEVLQKQASGELKRRSLGRMEELFEGPLLATARGIVEDAYAALERRHAVMHTVWSLDGPDAMTPVPALVAALESQDPDAALAELVGGDVDSPSWRTVHPKSGGPGPASVVELRDIRRALEIAQQSLESLRFTLASALYCGKPAGAKRVVNP